ncbi:MAG: hypothetical protein R3C17_20890 [Planctomycetaceae bacterium]
MNDCSERSRGHYGNADNPGFTTNVVTVGTNASTFTPGDAEVGKFLRVTISLYRRQRHSRKHQSPSDVSGNVNDVPTGTVTIDDPTPGEDQLLSASNTIADNDGLGTFTYTWERADNPGFTTNVVTVERTPPRLLRDAVVGKFLRVTISYTDGNGTAESTQFPGDVSGE